MLFYIQSSESSDSAESSNKIRIRQDSFRQRKFANFQFGSEIRMQHYGICHGRGQYTELRNGKKRGIDQSETSSHLTHLI